MGREVWGVKEKEETMPRSKYFKDKKWNDFFDDLIRRLERSPCDNTHRHAKALLKKMGEDVEKVLERFCANGGFCDCEVIWNVSGV